jgi:hypothetical protein
MANLSNVKTSGGSTSPSSISSSVTTFISTSGTTLIYASLSTTRITTLLFFLYLEYIMGMILHQLE